MSEAKAANPAKDEGHGEGRGPDKDRGHGHGDRDKVILEVATPMKRVERP